MTRQKVTERDILMTQETNTTSEPLGLIARLRSEAYRIAEYGLQRDHSMAADELERLLHKCRDAAALADVRLSEENDALIEQNKELLAALEKADRIFVRCNPEFEGYNPDEEATDAEWDATHAMIRAAIAKARTNSQ